MQSAAHPVAQPAYTGVLTDAWFPNKTMHPGQATPLAGLSARRFTAGGHLLTEGQQLAPPPGSPCTGACLCLTGDPGQKS